MAVQQVTRQPSNKMNVSCKLLTVSVRFTASSSAVFTICVSGREDDKRSEQWSWGRVQPSDLDFALREKKDIATIKTTKNCRMWGLKRDMTVQQSEDYGACKVVPGEGPGSGPGRSVRGTPQAVVMRYSRCSSSRFCDSGRLLLQI